MSRILDQALDPQRRAECEFNDRRVAAGEPCNLCGLPQALLEQPEPMIPRQLRYRPRRAARTLRTVRRALAVYCIGILVGHSVAATSCPVPMQHLQLDRSDVHTVPAAPTPHVQPRKVV